MRLVTLWLVASAETFRVHGASAAATPGGAKGVQGREPANKGLSKKQQRAAAAAAKEVCSVDDSPATCRELTAKYRGGGERVADQTVLMFPRTFMSNLSPPVVCLGTDMGALLSQLRGARDCLFTHCSSLFFSCRESFSFSTKMKAHSFKIPSSDNFTDPRL